MDDGSILRGMTGVLTAISNADMGGLAIYAVLIILLIAGGAYFAGAEIALASVNRVHMKASAEDGDRRAQYVMYILNNFDKALSTILIGNNIMHISCAAIVTLMTRQLFKNSGLLDAALAGATAITTIVVFFVAEMLPKSYAKNCNEAFALKIGKSLYLLMKVLTPLSAIFTWLGKAISTMFSSKKEELAVTEDDLKDLIESFRDDREEDEETEDATAELMANALEFGMTTAGETMTPWERVETLNTGMEIREIYEGICDGSYSRLPILNAKGRIVGVLNIRQFLRAYMKNGDDTELIDLMDMPFFVRPDMPVDELLREMSHSKVHLAFVSEQGHVQGIITIEDILEELVGEIFDEYDTVEEQEGPQ